MSTLEPSHVNKWTSMISSNSLDYYTGNCPEVLSNVTWVTVISTVSKPT